MLVLGMLVLGMRVDVTVGGAVAVAMLVLVFDGLVPMRVDRAARMRVLVLWTAPS